MAPDVTLDNETYAMVMFAARVGSMSPAEVIRKAVVTSVPTKQDSSAGTGRPSHQKHQIHMVYLRQRISGEIDAATGRVTITSGPLSGKSYKSPSGASMAVVRSINPDRSRSESNGWRDWIDDATGRPIGEVHR